MTDENSQRGVLDVNTCDINVLKEIILKRSQPSGASYTVDSPTVMIQHSGTRSMANPHGEPYVTIVEQPKQRGLRFRYKCEGRSAGSIPGESSTNEKKTYPSIKIHNFDGQAAIVVVSCVTKDKPFHPHPHNLVGQDCRDGVCTVKVKNPNTVITFPNIGIQCCKRHDVEENLKTRENIRVDPYGTGYPASSNNIDLNSVRLCFQVFLPDSNKRFTKIVQPVVSQPIIDKKSIHDLVICRLSRQSGYVSGGDEVFLLCEKINKDDIQVRFYQDTTDGVSWEAMGEFSPNDVHRQYAIVFKTPAYEDQTIQEPVTVFIQLRRPSDDEVGDPKPFQYIPLDPDPYGINQKRKRKEIMSSNLSSISRQIPSMVVEEGSKDDHEFGESGANSGSKNIRNRLKEKAEKSLLRNQKQNADVKFEPSSIGSNPPKYSLISSLAPLSSLSPAEIVQMLQNQSAGFVYVEQGSSTQNTFQLGNQTGQSQISVLNAAGDLNVEGLSGRVQVSGDSLNSFIENVMTYSNDSLPHLSGLSDIMMTGGSNTNSINTDLNVGAQEVIIGDMMHPKQEHQDMLHDNSS